MFKKAYITILLSLLLHVVIIVLLNNSQTMVIPNTKIPSTSIKSYIYIKPKEIKIKPTPQAKNQRDNAGEEKLTLKEKVIKQPEQLNEKDDIQSKKEPQQALESLPEVTPDHVATSINPVNPPEPSQLKSLPQQGFSYRSLQQLREKIQQQNQTQFQQELSQPNTGSVMHGTPTLVPHSTVLPTVDEKREQATSTLSAHKRVIKGDDGTCTIVEDLSAIGVEGVKAVSHFSCGETKFDKSFREHMEKVRKKLGKN